MTQQPGSSPAVIDQSLASRPRRPVRIANCSGFYGDRIAAAREMLAGLQAASAAARYAAAATAENADDAALSTKVAVLRTGEAYRDAAEAAIHILGGVGFTWEHDAHLYYRRAWSAQQLTGGAHAQRAAIADLAGL